MTAPIIKPPRGLPCYTCPQSNYQALKDLNPVRLLLSASSNSGKTCFLSCWCLDIMRGKYDIIYLISNSAEYDVVWNPLKKYVYEELGRDQKKKGEEWYWSSWSDQRLIDLMDDQRKHITEQRRLGQNKMRSVLFIIDDYADSPELHKVDGPLASLLSRGRHLFCSVAISSQKLSKISTLGRQNTNIGCFWAPVSHSEWALLVDEYSQLAASEEEPDGRDNFKRLLAYATKEKYSFLTILFKNPPETRFMLRLERFLSIKNETDPR